jgi:uncharacterized Zn finger protein
MSRRNSRYNSRYESQWPAYVPVAERRRKAELAMAKLVKKGVTVSPVKIEGRVIAATFWGKAWCENLESYRDYENRLERGRTYVRNGSVVDLQIAAREVTATVSGSALYKVKVSIGEVVTAHWKSICADCAGGIDSLVELLQGRFSKGVMERICRQGAGLFPKPSEIRFSCSCPDHASMCKHVAAVLYGVGARLDAQPELLFRLRAVNENDLVADIGKVLPMTEHGPAAGKVLEADDMAALFGLDMAGADELVEAGPPSAVPVIAGKTAAADRGAKVKGSSRDKPGAAERNAATPDETAAARKVTPSKRIAQAPRGEIVAVAATGARNGKVAASSRGKPEAATGKSASPRSKAAAGKGAAPKQVARPNDPVIDPVALQRLVSEISGRAKPALPGKAAKPQILARGSARPNARASVTPLP